MTPFKIDVPQTTLDAIRAKVAAYEWHEMPRGDGLDGTWAYGANLDFMRTLCAYWVDGYDWRKWEAALNAHPQFTATIDDLDLHFYHAKGSGAAQPLILSHGWPGSVFEFLHIIDSLAHPEKHGGDAKDAFDVVVPSLPGYGWSGKPKRPIGPRRTAQLFDRLMTEVLGYDGYIAQGGDWGSAISAYMSYEGKGCRAAHLNMMGWVTPGVGPESDEEKAFAAKAGQLFEMEGAYFREQTTKPQTLSYGMMDSPVGVAAWIVEKFHGWSDTRKGFENTYTKDQLLTNVMIYLVTRTFNTATWMYRGRAEEAFMNPLPRGTRLEKPTGIAAFPVDLIPFPPRSQVERSINVARWDAFEEGGHFAALERPDDLVRSIRAFARGL
jgi:pimeloyl-ACP methyl ester carboxylesterase